MLNQERVTKLINHWIETSNENFITMEHLYKDKRYSDSLFFGHLILEKVLKALVVKETKDFAPRLHNLVRLAEIACLDLNLEMKKFLAKVSEFNMEARYPEEKRNFYKLCTKGFTDTYYDRIIKLYKQLCLETMS